MRTGAITERLRGVITTRRYTNSCLPYITLPSADGVSFTRPCMQAVFYRSTAKVNYTSKFETCSEHQRYSDGQRNDVITDEYYHSAQIMASCSSNSTHAYTLYSQRRQHATAFDVQLIQYVAVNIRDTNCTGWMSQNASPAWGRAIRAKIDRKSAFSKRVGQ